MKKSASQPAAPAELSMKPKRAKVVTELKDVALATPQTWVLKVAGYRLYCLDGVNKVASADWIEADDDQAAIEVAKISNGGQLCEVWQGPRLVARIDLRRR